jgi:hypothetical protein
MSKSSDLERHGSEAVGWPLIEPPLIKENPLKYMLMDYVNEAGWPQLTRTEQEYWLGAYRAYMEAMTNAGVLKSSSGLYPTSTATTVRAANDKPQVLDGPYADSKEQLGGFHIIEVADLDAAIAWAARSPTARHGVVEVRPVRDGTLLTTDMSELIKPE